MRPSIRIIGCGNPLLADGTAGFYALKELEAECRSLDIAVTSARHFAGGLDLIDEVIGFEYVLFIDTFTTGLHAPGTCTLHTPSTLGACVHSRVNSPHGPTLAQIVVAGERCGYSMPRQLLVLALEGTCFDTFSEVPTPAVCRGLRYCVSLGREIISTWARNAEYNQSTQFIPIREECV